MALTYSTQIALGTPAPAFDLPGVDGAHATLDSFKGARALVVMFICNHCPYVKAVNARLVALAADYAPRGVAFVAISSNDAARYPDDSFEKMQQTAREEGYTFPYLYDESQEVAQAYGAVCTPDFFVYDATQRLAYRGRLDDNWKDEAAITRRDLRAALDAILAGEQPGDEQVPSMGCSIKWRF
jgi:peroxiredoxin